VNHYERLKVNPDAPVEVIRAAYRALAAKYHPDRHTQSQSTHAEMVALNAAYEVLADPHTRAAYDAELNEMPLAAEGEQAGPASRFQNLWRSTMGFAGMDTVPPAPPPTPDEQGTRVDVQWQPPLPIGAANPWLSRKRLLPLFGELGVLIMITERIWWVRAALLQMEAEQTLSQHYSGGRKSSGTEPAPPGPASRAAANHQGTPPAMMSDEELLAEPPPLSAQPSLASRSNHLLDGTPLSLRQETHLVDPLAPVPMSRPASSAP